MKWLIDGIAELRAALAIALVAMALGAGLVTLGGCDILRELVDRGERALEELNPEKSGSSSNSPEISALPPGPVKALRDFLD